MEMGVRQTRQKLTEIIKRVQQGESMVITDRKRPVAKIVPLNKSKTKLHSHSELRSRIHTKGKTLSQLVLEGRENR